MSLNTCLDWFNTLRLYSYVLNLKIDVVPKASRCSGRENNYWSIISTHGVAVYLLIYAPPLFVYLTIPGCLFLSGNGNTIQWWINVRENWRDNKKRKIQRNWQHCVLDTGRRQQNKTYNTERLKDEQYTEPTKTRDEPMC
jgi:hypothetical protein